MNSMTDSPLISDGYRKQYEQLHRSSTRYGSGAHRWAGIVRHLVREYGLRDVLDYGCGKQALKAALPELEVRGYDPAFPELAGRPDPADLLFCCDVLEHVEPSALSAVLDELQRLTRRVGFLLISTRPARQILADGRNAHLIVQPGADWARVVADRFDIVYMLDYVPELKRKRTLRARIARWALEGLRIAVPKEDEVLFVVRPRKAAATT